MFAVAISVLSLASLLFQSTTDGIEMYAHGSTCANPMVLVASGGPCMPFTGVADGFFRPFETKFTMLYYDTRGVGRSAGTTTSSWQQHVDDAIGVARHGLARCSQTRLSVLGYSAGTLIALNVSSQAPELVERVITIALKVDQERGMPVRHEAVERVYGIPPSITSSLPLVMQRAIFFSGPHRYACYTEPSTANCLGGFSYTAQDTTLTEVYGIRGALVPLQAELCRMRLGDEWNLIRLDTIGTLHAPWHIIHGRYDHMDPAAFVEAAVDNVNSTAPKHMIWFEESSHDVFSDQPGLLRNELHRMLHST